MQPDNPYRLIEALGSSQVGSVWSALDAEGRPLTVAILDASVALNQSWRDAFAAAANGLAQPQAGGPRVRYTDFDAPAPWVACAADEGPGAEQVFLALGVTYQPVPPDDSADSSTPTDSAASEAAPDEDTTTVISGAQDGETTQPTEKIAVGGAEPVNPWASEPTQPVSPSPLPSDVLSQQPVPAPPSAATSPTSTPPYPVSPQPHSTSAPPHSTSAPPHSTSAPPHLTSGPPYSTSGAPFPQSPTYTPYGPPTVPAPAPARRRIGLLAGVVVLVALMVGATGGTLAGFALAGDGSSTPSTAESETPAPPLPTPSQPGVEPPTGAAWPQEWPRFSGSEPTREIFPVEGTDFSFVVPQAWACQPAANEPGLTHYRCGIGDEQREIGGDIEIRNCPAPCDENRWAEMRKAVDAWGLQWARSGNFLYWAQTDTIDGASRYGLVFVLFWRSSQEKALDREVIFRMSSTPQRANELRKVANSVRDSVSRWEF